MDSRRKTPVVDFDVERHTLVTGKIIQVFHHSSAAVTQCSAVRAHSSRVRGQLLRGFLVDLSHPRRILRFPSNPFERRATCIFCLVPHPIPIVESLGRIFPEEEGRIPPGVSIWGPDSSVEGLTDTSTED
jgi:hypothetical protein